jgi:AcrR family transcriptional regulator
MVTALQMESSTEVKKVSSKSKLIDAAITLFSERGYEGTSVKDLVEHTGVNVSLINYYFGGKRGLLAAALSSMAHEKLLHAKRMLRKAETKMEFKIRLENFLEELCLFFIQRSSLIKLFYQELEQGHEEAENEFSETYLGVLNELEKFLKGAKSKKFAEETADVHVLLIQILSPFSTLVRAKNSTRKYFKVSLDDSVFRKKLIESLVQGVVLPG